MGWLSNIFGGGSKTTTVENDPYKNMPEWMQDAYRNDAAFREDLLDDASRVSSDMARQDPREILGVSDSEKAALGYGLSGLNDARDTLGDLGDYRGDWQYGKAGRELGEASSTDNKLMKIGDNLSDINLQKKQKNYMGRYTDDVVDTTLAGMQRQADRESLQRESANAAIGGTTNTRQAVSDAVAGQLTGMNMGEMEAKLRDEAHRFGVGAGEDAARFALDKRTTKGDLYESAGRFGLNEADSRMALGDRRAELDEMANRFGLDTAKLESALGLGGAGLLDQYGEKKRGLTQAGLDAEYDAENYAEREALTWLNQIYSGSATPKGPVGSTQSTTEPTAGLGQQIIGAAIGAAGSFI